MSSDAERSPFERFDQAMGSETCLTPYPEFAALRARGEIVRREPEALSGAAAMLAGEEPPPLYSAVSYRAVSEVLRNSESFSSGAYRESMGVVMGPNILVMDPPEHGTLRHLIQGVFSQKALERWEEELVHPVVHGMIDALADRGRADLVPELTFPFPVHVIAGMLGLPEEDIPKFHSWAVDLISVAFDWQRGLESTKRLAEYLTPIIEARRAAPGDDLISHLVCSVYEDAPLDTEHVLGFLRLLLPAGAETTSRSTANLLFALITHPEQMEALRGDRSLMPQAIEEGLRWEVPLTSISRLCVRDTVVAGVSIPAGAIVDVSLGSANHDESRFDQPEAFDLFRPPRQHMSFAFGPHRCLGMHLARMETRVVVDAVLDRLPNLRIDLGSPSAAEKAQITGKGFRSPRSLPVRFG